MTADTRRRDRTRDEVLAVATRVIAERGFDATSMWDIADALDFGVSGLYRHVKSKDDVLLSVTAPLLDGVDALLSQPCGDRRALLSAYQDLLAAQRTVARLVGSDAAVQLHTAIGGRVREQDARFRQILAPHGPGDVELEARTAAALGVIWWPLLCLPDHVPANKHLVDLAVSLLP